jgi:hypothetical protein
VQVTSTLTVDKKHKVAGATIISYMATVGNDHVWLASERMVFVLNIQVYLFISYCRISLSLFSIMI